MSGERALGFGSALDCIEGARECDKERVALCIHFTPVPFLNGCAQNFVMLTQCNGILIAKLFEQTGRAFDVGEEEGDRAGWLSG